MKVFASVTSYALGCTVGHGAAGALLHEVAAKGARADLPDWVQPFLPGARTVNRLAALADVTLAVEAGGTRVAVTRSRMLHNALKSSCDAWFTIDDDVETDAKTLQHLLDAVAGDEPRVCILPCLLRGDGAVINVMWAPLVLTRRLPNGGMARRASYGGFGAVVMNRAAMQLAADASFKFRDADGEEKPAAFFEEYDEKSKLWFGEDYSFFRKLPPSVEVEALVTGTSVHARQPLDLAAANA